ncbi:MAG: flagellar assembly protein A [Pseudomonadota bacterium]
MTENASISTDSSAALAADRCIIKRADGVFVDPGVMGPVFQNAVNNLFSSNAFFRGLNYPVFIKAMFGTGPDLPRAPGGEVLIRFAADIVPFDSDRRALYKAVKINHGVAEYFFEPVFLPNGADPEGDDLPARLDVDEFVADMWTKGIRFGLDLAQVRSAMGATKSERVTVACRLDPAPGVDAQIIEVSSDIHRSDAPRQLANGKLDLMAFQNRFPQIAKGVKLLQKVPRTQGQDGFELSGARLEPPVPKDVALGPLAGPGTLIETNAGGEFLVSVRSGFLNVDSKSHQIAIGDKIVSRDGVSARTTGNLHLTGDYEEFGEVQEKRLIEGDSITIHADVFGNIVSRGGTIVLDANLVGGTAHNADGNITVKGVASGAVLQTKSGLVSMVRAESCVISGTRVQIEHASNCEIIADEVEIGLAEGCAIAARRVTLERCGPRRQSEMLVYVLVPDSDKIDRAMTELKEQAEAGALLAHQRQQQLDALTSAPEVRQFMLLQNKIRKQEIVLTPEQQAPFQKMALAIGPKLKAIGLASNEIKSMVVARQVLLERLSQLARQKHEATGDCRLALRKVDGATQARIMHFHPDGASVFDIAPKDIKQRLRGPASGETIFGADSGALDWTTPGQGPA